jgi:hypothetical protein
MKANLQAERRREERYPQNIEVAVQMLPSAHSAEPCNFPSIPGRIQNISRNGICLVTSEPIRLSSVLRCEMPVSDSDIRFTTLMRLRWTRKSGTAFISGLEAFL